VSGADFRTARKALGLNQTQIADRLGVTQKTVSYWETGKQPDIPKAIELAMKQLKAEYIERLQGSGV
jgi:transcriptional regulator with XRE-family HTH domain